MTEQEILLHAKTYIDKLANGINPLTDEPVAETDIVNNVRISRCLFYVSGILKNTIEQKNTPPASTKKKKPFELTMESRTKFAFSQEPITITEIVARLNNTVNLEEYKRLRYPQVTEWLIEIGALREENIDGKPKKMPTEQGIELGISTEQRQGEHGIYTVILYNRSAQQFILDNMDAILANPVTGSGRVYQGQPWSEEHQACLIELFRKQVPIPEIAATLQRTSGGIRSRLQQLGLM